MTRPQRHPKLVALGLIAAGLGFLTGCPQPAPSATFTAGSGPSEFGTIDDGKGTTFQITEIGDGFGITSNGEAGDAVYEVDGEGRLTYIETDLVTATFIYNADGSTSVTGSLELENSTKTFDGVIPAATTKARSRSQGGSICRAVDFFCTNLDAILLFVEAALLREGGYQDNPDNDSVIRFTNSLVEIGVNKAMQKVIGPAQAFCGVWPEIRAEIPELCN